MYDFEDNNVILVGSDRITNDNYQRDDNQPGYVYLMVADGFHGLMGGLVRRVKIGLSRNPMAREDRLNSNQPPCNINVIDTVYVYRMKDCEDYLHKKYKSHHVKLRKSTEWFDFDYVSYHLLLNDFKSIKNNPRWSPNAKRFFINVNLNLVGVVAAIALLFGVSFVISSQGLIWQKSHQEQK
jgi:T5orf172 domain